MRAEALPPINASKTEDKGFKVLCEIPDKVICSKEFSVENELVGAVGNLLRLLLSLEWCCWLISQCLKTPNHVNSIDTRLILSGRDLLRRLFSLYRATLIEVSSFISSRLEDKVKMDIIICLHLMIISPLPSATLLLHLRLSLRFV